MISRKSKLAILAALFWMQFSPGAGAAVGIGEMAPALVVRDMKGQLLDVQKFRDRVVIINMWASWCGACRAEIRTLNAFYQAHHAEGFEIIGLSMDRRRDKDKARKMAGEMSYPAAFADEAIENGFDEVKALPVTYVIDPKGKVRAILDEGMKSVEELEKAVYR